ncbi:MAG: N-acetylmuramoyl-L-alanine amidase, partial [Candidatus Omnitrophota bacterium]
VSKRIKRDLENQGIKVYLTREKDVFIPLGDRPAFAKKKNADLFVSVHANAARQSQIKGFEVFYLSEATDDNARALAAAENESLKFEEISPDVEGNSNNPTLWDLVLSENRRQSKELAYYICNTTSDRLCMKKRGVKGARFAVLKGASMPAVLIEVGFLSNSREESKLKTESFRAELADAVSRSIRQYKEQYENTNGFSR